MADKAASVLARLKNKSVESGRSYQLCLQLFCQEEFLRRLEKSKYVDNFVLKGGLFIYTLTEFESRVTMDIDLLLQKLPNTPEELEPIIMDIISTDTGNDYVKFELKGIQPISIAKKYAGISASLVAVIKNTRTPIKIDFGVGDVIVPSKEKRSIPTQLDEFKKPVINTYSLETTIAEKVDAILDLMEYSSRMKDYYDLYYLLTHFKFDSDSLAEAIKKSFEIRNHHFTTEQYEKVLSLGDDDAMNKKWQAFIRKTKLQFIDFRIVIETINSEMGNTIKNVLKG